MKKKAIILLASVLLVAMCALTFAACTPTSVGKYMEALKKAEYGTIEMNTEGIETTMSFNGENIYIKYVMDGKSSEIYIIADGTKKSGYYLANNVWTKTEDADEIKSLLEEYNVKKIFADINADESKYDIKDGVWTEKEYKTAYKVEKGKLAVYVASKLVGTYSLAKPTIKLPQAAKDAKAA